MARRGHDKPLPKPSVPSTDGRALTHGRLSVVKEHSTPTAAERKGSVAPAGPASRVSAACLEGGDGGVPARVCRFRSTCDASVHARSRQDWTECLRLSASLREGVRLTLTYSDPCKLGC